MTVTDEEMVRAFEAASLPASEFDHRAHVRVGWWYVRNYPLDHPIERIRRDLQAFASANGAPGKYDDEMTIGYMRAIAERVRQAPGLDWPGFAARYPDLFVRPGSGTGAPGST